jgi:hypothetical protein
MKSRTFFLLICFCLILAFIVGCAASSTGVFQSGKDTYTVVVTGGNGYARLGDLQKRAYQEANEFCRMREKKFQPVATKADPKRFKSFELRFRALSPDDPEYRRPDLEPVPDVKVDVKGQ